MVTSEFESMPKVEVFNAHIDFIFNERYKIYYFFFKEKEITRKPFKTRAKRSRRDYLSSKELINLNL